MNEICRDDKRYVKVIGESAVVKNAAKLLSGRKLKEMEGEKKDEEEEEDNGKGRAELKVREKIRLLELLVTLVKGGVGMGDEEELMEAALRLEEEANNRVEQEDVEEEAGEGNVEEKREWEELSERAHELVWAMEMMNTGREGKERKRR